MDLIKFSFEKDNDRLSIEGCLENVNKKELRILKEITDMHAHKGLVRCKTSYMKDIKVFKWKGLPYDMGDKYYHVELKSFYEDSKKVEFLFDLPGIRSYFLLYNILEDEDIELNKKAGAYKSIEKLATAIAFSLKEAYYFPKPKLKRVQ